MNTPKTDIKKIRDDFPILRQLIHGHPLAYLDNAATTQKPTQVIERLQHFYQHANANVHRGTHQLTEIATDLFETARDKVKNFMNAPHRFECIFVRGATEGINLIVNGFSRSVLGSKDEILISQIEHHSNIVPWQLVCEYTGAKLRIIPCNDQGELLLDEYADLLNEKTKIVALTHLSNALGTINPVQKMIQMAHENGTPVLIDGAQAAPHLRIDVQALDCDFYTFSGHKMYGPTGVGVLYGKSEWLEKLPPFQAGGEMIQSVSFDKTTYNKLPYKFEAGTPAIAQAIGLGAAIDYLEQLGFDKIGEYEADLYRFAMDNLATVPHISFVGTATEKTAVISFLLGDIHPHDVGTVLNNKGIAVRTGQLCAEPTLARFGLKSVVRASLGLYNTKEEILRLVEALHETQTLFKRNNE